MKDVATGTSPAPANATEAIRNVVVMLLMSPRFVNHLELAGTPISGRAGLPGPRPLRGRVAALVHVLADAARRRAAGRRRGRIAGDRRRLRHAARSRVRRSRARATRSGSSGTSGCGFESFTGFSAERPAFMALAAGENLGVAGHDHWGDMVREIRDLTNLYTWTQPGTFARSHDVGPVGHAFGRSRPPLRRAGLERQRRLPALHRRQPARAPAARGAARRRASSRPTRSTAARSSGASILCDNLPQPGPQQPAARVAGPAAAEHGDDHAPALPGQGRGQRPVPGVPLVVQQPRLRDGVVRRARPLPHDGEGVRRADGRAAGDAAARHQRRAAGDRRRHARRSAARRS